MSTINNSILSTLKEKPQRYKKHRKHTRAAKACSSCRTKKTRCLWVNGTVKCLRCLSLNIPCSLEKSHESVSNTRKEEGQREDSGIEIRGDRDKRLDEISDDVKSLIELFKRRVPTSRTEILPTLDIARNQSKFSESHIPINMTGDLNGVASASSMNMMAILAMKQSNGNAVGFENSLPRTILAGMGYVGTESAIRSTNPVITGILSRQEGTELLRIFTDRYGRWISFPESYKTENIYEKTLSRCPLLFTVMCALALKYGDPVLKERCYLRLLRVIKYDLSQTMLNPPLCLEYIQVLVILSLYGTNLSESLSVDLCLDSWELSSQALSIFMKMNRLGLYSRLYSVEDVEPEFNELTVHRIWNIMVLVHLAYCLLLGRKSNFSLAVLCTRDVSQFGMSTKFDYRIVSECSIYSAIYKFTILNASRQTTVEEIENWMHHWDFMFGKPLNQFIEIDFHWVWILLYLKEGGFTFNGQSLSFTVAGDASSSAEGSKLQAMENHAYKVLELIDTIKDDSYFAFLSDQIHLIVFFVSIVSIELLSCRINKSKELMTAVKESATGKVLVLLLRYIYRLRKVSTTNEHPFFKFSTILEQSLTSKFDKQDLEATGLYSENAGISGTPYTFEDPGDEEEEAQELGQL